MLTIGAARGRVAEEGGDGRRRRAAANRARRSSYEVGQMVEGEERRLIQAL